MMRQLWFLLANLMLVIIPLRSLPAETQGTKPVNAVTNAPVLNFEHQLDHYDEAGYPEDRRGELVLRDSPDGPVVPFAGDETALLYAQYVNEQRDAVYLARTGDFSDTLPNGKAYVIPYGFGALKQNEVYLSLIEGRETPHMSDDQKKYTLFPLQDFYLGGALSLSGVTANFRYTYLERYTGHLSIGANVWGSLFPETTFGSYLIPLHLGGGFRFPGILPTLLGPNSFTLGLDLFTGWGKLAVNHDGPAFFCLPGAFLDFEEIFYQGVPHEQDFRRQAEPYNYGVNSLFVRVGMYLNTADPIRSGLIVWDISCGFLCSFKGPSIPAHKFKETKPVFTHTLYREEIERQHKQQQQRNGSQLQTQSETKTASPIESATAISPAHQFANGDADKQSSLVR